MKNRVERVIVILIVTTLISSGMLQAESPDNNEGVTGTPEGWSEDVRLTDDAKPDVKSAICIEDNHVSIAWEKDTTGAGGHYDIYYIDSTDGGTNWNSPFLLTSGISGTYCRDPDIGCGNNIIHVVWSDNNATAREIKYRRSTDGGQSWLPEQMISANDGFNSQGPKIAISEDGQSIHVVWVDSRLSSTEVYYKRSVDGGATWDDGLNNTGLDRRITHDLSGAFPLGISASGPNIHVLFGDDRDGSFDVYYIRSTNNGATWDNGAGIINEERKLTANATKHGPGVLAVQDSSIHVVWVDEVWPGPVYYFYYRNSTDNGVSWSDTRLLVDSLYSHAPDIRAEGNTVHLVWHDWRDDGSTTEVYCMNSTDGGINWGLETRLTYNEGNHSSEPKIAVHDSKIHIAWRDNRDGNNEIYYKRYPDFPTDTGPPEIEHEPTISAVIGQVINITANVTDNVAVDAVYLNYTGVNGTNHNVTMQKLNGNWSFDIPGQTNTGIVEYFIWANDTSGNANMTMNYTIQIYDVTAPVITHAPPPPTPLHTPIIIVANVTDDVGVSDVTLYYANVDDTDYTAVDMALVSGNWSYEIPAQTKTGSVHYFIWANDTSGNNATSPDMGAHIVQITGPPGIAIIEPGGGERWTGGSNQWIEFIASDTEDEPALLVVFLNYTSAIAGNDTIAQINGNESPYNWKLPTINATDVRIIATVIDSDGNKAFAESPMFAIDSSMPEIISTNPVNNSTGVSINQPVIIQFNEPMNISSVVVNQTNGTNSGGWQWFWNEDRDTVTGIHNAWPRGETIEITVHAGYKDAFNPGNINDTVYVFRFTTEINPAPEIIHSNVTGPQELGDAIRINATITDDGTVMNAVLWWRDVDGVWHESRMQKNGDDWFYIVPGQMKEGRVRYQINATDDLGQKNSTIIYEFDVEDTILPVITHKSVENAVIDEPINITCLVADLGGVNTVYLHYRNESEANYTQVTMSPGYWHELAARSEPGTIEYFISAVDAYGNEASTGIYSLGIIDPAIPDTTPPEVLLVGPTGNNIPISMSISIVFNEAMDRAAVEGAITVSPGLTGITYTWLNDRTLVLSFDALRYNTTYTVTVGTGARDMAGNGLASANSWQFTTVGETEIIQQPAPNDWGWIGIIIFLIAVIALLLLYLFNKEKKEPDNIEEEPMTKERGPPDT